MNTNWNFPVLTTLYADFLAQMKSRDEDNAVMFESTTSTNLPIGTKRWNGTGNKFENWSGTAWSDLATLYEIKVRDSDKLNGQSASFYCVKTENDDVLNTKANVSDVYTKLQTDSKISFAVANIVSAAPTTLDTLNELAIALGNDANFATTMATELGKKAPTANPVFTGLVTASNFKGNLDGTAANASKLNGQNWNWSGQGGQPTWLWGGNDGTNMYVYNPSDFVVYRANNLDNHQWDGKQTNGYIRLSTGLIVQWGEIHIQTSGHVNWPIGFPNVCVQATVSQGYAGNTSTDALASVYNLSTSGADIQNGQNTGGIMRYIAIGW